MRLHRCHLDVLQLNRLAHLSMGHHVIVAFLLSTLVVSVRDVGLGLCELN